MREGGEARRSKRPSTGIGRRMAEQAEQENQAATPRTPPVGKMGTEATRRTCAHQATSIETPTAVQLAQAFCQTATTARPTAVSEARGPNVGIQTTRQLILPPGIHQCRRSVADHSPTAWKVAKVIRAPKPEATTRTAGLAAEEVGVRLAVVEGPPQLHL